MSEVVFSIIHRKDYGRKATVALRYSYDSEWYDILLLLKEKTTQINHLCAAPDDTYIRNCRNNNLANVGHVTVEGKQLK